MTENQVAAPIRSSYEQIRDGLSHREARELWRDADLRKEHQRQNMQAIHDDPNLSDEGKRERAQHLLDTSAPNILQSYADARTKLEAAVETSWQFSIPMPNEKTLATTSIADSNEMIAVQNEANAIAQRIEGTSLQAITQEKTKTPGGKGIQQASNHKLRELRAEFDSAMRTGGVEGKIRALGIKRFCEAKGMSLDDVVDGHRRQVHRNAYADAQAFEAAAFSVPTGRGLGENPYDAKHGRRGAKAVGAYQSGNKAVASSGAPNIFAKKKRKPAWK